LSFVYDINTMFLKKTGMLSSWKISHLSEMV
jgi:hypothetical protein